MKIKKIVIMIVVVIAGLLIWRFFFYQAGSNNGETFLDADLKSAAPVKDGSIAPSQRKAYEDLQQRWRENQQKSASGNP